MLGRAILAVVLLDVILAAPLQDGNNQYGVDVADFQEVGPVKVGVLIASSQDVQNQRSLATFIDTDEIVAQPLRQDPNVPVLSGFIAPETNPLGKREAQKTNRQAILPDDQSLDTPGVVIMSKKSLSLMVTPDEKEVGGYEELPVGVNDPNANVEQKRASVGGGGTILADVHEVAKAPLDADNANETNLPDEQSADEPGVVIIFIGKKSLSTVPILDEQDVGVQMANVQAYEGLPVGVNVPSANVDRKREAQYAFLPITDEYQQLAVDSRPFDPPLVTDYPIGIVFPDYQDPFGKRDSHVTFVDTDEQGVPSLSDEAGATVMELNEHHVPQLTN